jgi:hypothetical protein
VNVVEGQKEARLWEQQEALIQPCLKLALPLGLSVKGTNKFSLLLVSICVR